MRFSSSFRGSHTGSPVRAFASSARAMAHPPNRPLRWLQLPSMPSSRSATDGSRNWFNGAKPVSFAKRLLRCAWKNAAEIATNLMPRLKPQTTVAADRHPESPRLDCRGHFLPPLY
ncbi:MAG: hypothetical protein ACKV2Q_11145 [Planctomycetaceae bacterium]